MASGFDLALSPFLSAIELRRLVEIAFVAIEVGEPIYAEGIFEGLLSLCSDEPGFVFGFALALLSQQRYEEALAFLKNHSDLCQSHEELSLLLCLSLRDFGYFHESEQHVSSLEARSHRADVLSLMRLFFGR